MDFFVQIFKDLFENAKAIGNIFSYVWFIVLPMAFYYLFKVLWLEYIRTRYGKSIKYVLLEIIPPRNVEKSPKPMESLYWGISGVLKTFNALEEFVKGMTTFKFSLELMSSEGTVHFYIRTPVQFRNLVEAHLYAQYPDAVIKEAPDYINEVPKIVPNREWNLWGTDFELVKPDLYPIRTFRYFEEDITGKMIDPLSGLVETMGKLGPNQKIWFQYVIVPEYEVHKPWVTASRAVIDKLAGRDKKQESVWSRIWSDIVDVISNIGNALFGPVEFTKKEEAKEEAPLEFRLTPVEKEILKAVENNFGKNAFKVKMRFIYFGKTENYDPTFISAFVGGIKQFNDINLNSFKPYDKAKTFADYILVEPRLRHRQRKIFRRYRDRDTDGKTFYLSTEELATVYHLPDMSVVAPSVTYVEAKRGGAPANLPVE
ncbi:MAG: hypothetical protein NT136_04070 [Candidatus Moranbacteria bacterium]|nr:hypothetical protein [Candidatus Moranbacteria bacterium]